jgi:hypothetical protein
MWTGYSMYRRLKQRLRQARGALFGFISRRAGGPDPWGSPMLVTVLSPEWSGSTSVLLILALATCLFCDTACSTLEAVTERLIAPLEMGVRGRRPASTVCPCGLIRSLRQWLCSPSHNEKNCRLSRFIQISHNPPPLYPSLSTHCI